MRHVISAAVCCLLLFLGTPTARAQADLIDITKVKVRGDKSTEYENAVRKLIEINRKNKGDHWIALDMAYGDLGTLYFISWRDSMAGIEKASGAFEAAGVKALGQAGFGKLMQDLMSTSVSAQNQIRRRRPELSSNPPADMAAQMKMIAQSRWIRIATVDLKPGRASDFAAAWLPYRDELAKAVGSTPILVSSAVTGTPAIYVATYFKSMADMDPMDVATRALIQSDAYKSFTKTLGDVATNTTWEILRIRPELSCVPDELMNLDPGFWKPKPAAAATKPKPE